MLDPAQRTLAAIVLAAASYSLVSPPPGAATVTKGVEPERAEANRSLKPYLDALLVSSDQERTAALRKLSAELAKLAPGSSAVEQWKQVIAQENIRSQLSVLELNILSEALVGRDLFAIACLPEGISPRDYFNDLKKWRVPESSRWSLPTIYRLNGEGHFISGDLINGVRIWSNDHYKASQLLLLAIFSPSAANWAEGLLKIADKDAPTKTEIDRCLASLDAAEKQLQGAGLTSQQISMSLLEIITSRTGLELRQQRFSAQLAERAAVAGEDRALAPIDTPWLKEGEGVVEALIGHFEKKGLAALAERLKAIRAPATPSSLAGVG